MTTSSRYRLHVDLAVLPDICEGVEVTFPHELERHAEALMRTLGVVVHIDPTLAPKRPAPAKRERRRGPRTHCLRCGIDVDGTTPGCSTCKRRHKARRYAGRPTRDVEPRAHQLAASDPPSPSGDATT